MSTATTIASGGARTRIRGAVSAPDLAFYALLALGAVLVVVEMHGFSFFADEWDLLIDRRGFSPAVLFQPHGPHLYVVPVLIYKAMLAIFGMRSYTPYKLLAAANLVLLALAVGIFTRHRWGPWWGLVPVALLVTLSPGFGTLLFPFQVGVMAATTTGIIALFAADSRRHDLLACLALCVALGNGSQGIGFLFGVAVVIALAPRRWNRAWVVAMPALLYALWYVGYGHQHSVTKISQWAKALPFAVQTLSSTLSSLVGLARLEFGPTRLESNAFTALNPTYGQWIALALVTIIWIALWRGWRPPRLFWGMVVTLVLLWVAIALSPGLGRGRTPEASRYLPTDAALVLLAAVVALPRPRVGTGGCVLACVTLAAIAATNAGEFGAYRTSYATLVDNDRAVLGALLIARNVVEPDFSPQSPPVQLNNVRARPFFRGVDDYGTQVYTAAQLTRLSEPERQLSDELLIRAERIEPTPATPPVRSVAAAPALISGPARTSAGCLTLTGTEAVAASVPAKGVEIVAPPGTNTKVLLARFSAGVSPGGGFTELSGGAAVKIQLPADRAPSIPWRVSATGIGTRICAL